MVGRVRSFNPEKYGFIAIEGGLEFFFLRSSVIGPVRAGDEVDFWLASGRKSGELVAVDVRRRIVDRTPGVEDAAFSTEERIAGGDVVACRRVNKTMARMRTHQESDELPRETDAVRADQCPRCGMKGGVHAKAEACIAALRDHIADLEFRLNRR